jgi:hypothetical protein
MKSLYLSKNKEVLSSLKKVNGLKNDSFSPAHRWKYAL